MPLSVLATAAALVLAPPHSAACPSEGTLNVSDPAPAPALLLRPHDRRGPNGAQTLASLPPANLQLTVMRSVGGCAVSTVIRENAQGDNRFARPR